MKKFILSLAALLTICASACSQSKQAKQTEEKKVEKKTLVAYFSATGTTAAAAQQLAKAANADLYEIVPEKAYTDADLDWTNKQSRSTVEMKNLKSRPAIKGTVSNLAQYDTVYVGFPIWWYTAPTIINTFVEKNNLEGKVLVTFATSGGSTVTKATKDLQAAYPKLNWNEGMLLNGNATAEAQQLVAKVRGQK